MARAANARRVEAAFSSHHSLPGPQARNAPDLFLKYSTKTNEHLLCATLDTVTSQRVGQKPCAHRGRIFVGTVSTPRKASGLRGDEC